MNKQLINLLTVCRKAGKMTMGFDAVKDALLQNKAKAVLLAEDISPKTEKEVRFYAAKSGTHVESSGCTLEEIYIGIGKKAGVIAVCDEGFAKRAVQLANENKSRNTDE